MNVDLSNLTLARRLIAWISDGQPIGIVLLLLALAGCQPTTTDPELPAPVDCADAGGEIAYYDIDGAGIWLPGAFTPNGDGINDSYWISGNLYDQFSITIRQGNRVVFQSADRQKAWDGTVDGKSAPEGSYRVKAEGRFTQNRPFSLETQLNLIRTCQKGLTCKTGDQFTDRGFIGGSLSTDPLLTCQ